MEIKVTHVQLSERGKRDNNEDSVLTQSLLYMVCDGVGGSARGEVASQLSAKTIAHYFKTQPFDPTQSISYIQSAVRAAELALHTYLAEHPESKGMATTLALLHFHAQGATIAHVGDSRVYHYRRDEPLFVTQDHSLVMDLLRAGWITQEEVRDHPRRNVITRVIQAHLEKPVQVAAQIITDIQIGDRFMLCSDGVTEAFTEEELKQCFELHVDNQSFIQAIQTKCARVSNDNYSCIVLNVQDVKGSLPGDTHFASDIEVTSEVQPTNEILNTSIVSVPLNVTSVEPKPFTIAPAKTILQIVMEFCMDPINVSLVIILLLLVMALLRKYF